MLDGPNDETRDMTENAPVDPLWQPSSKKRRHIQFVHDAADVARAEH